MGYNSIFVSADHDLGINSFLYEVIIKRGEAASDGQQKDATLSGLSLSGVNLNFDPATTEYAINVANDVAETTVAPTLNDAGSSHVIKLNGVEDADGTVSLAEGDNFITVEVTAEDGVTTQTYTVTVNRAKPHLTASFKNTPESHDGQASFTFELRFSEEPDLSYKTLRDHAFTVAGEEVLVPFPESLTIIREIR